MYRCYKLLPAFFLLTACSPSEEPTVGQAPTPPPAATPSMAAPSLDAPPVLAVPSTGTIPAPPPAVPGAAPAAAPVAQGTMPKNAKNLAAYQSYFDENGNQLNGIAILQRAAFIYEQRQSSQAPDDLDGDGEDDPITVWPPLTNINLLVEKRILPSLPPAPAGQEFFFNQETRQVDLRPKQ